MPHQTSSGARSKLRNGSGPTVAQVVKEIGLTIMTCLLLGVAMHRVIQLPPMQNLSQSEQREPGRGGQGGCGAAGFAVGGGLPMRAREWSDVKPPAPDCAKKADGLG